MRVCVGVLVCSRVRVCSFACVRACTCLCAPACVHVSLSSVVEVIATIPVCICVVGVCWCTLVVHLWSRAVQSMYCGALWCHRWAHQSSVLWWLCSESGTCKGCCPLPPVPCACCMAVVTVNCVCWCRSCRRDLHSPVVGLGVCVQGHVCVAGNQWPGGVPCGPGKFAVTTDLLCTSCPSGGTPTLIFNPSSVHFCRPLLYTFAVRTLPP
jgi:hypothetical protein